MRRTQRQRFLNRIQSDVVTRRFHRCVQCKDDVNREPVHRMKFLSWGNPEWRYLCTGRTCAPTRVDALNYWQKEEKDS